jgi:nucleotide-binding universal stress UspA family protein
MTGFELGSDGPSVIVLGYDGSPPATRAAAYAAGLARRHGGLLLVVTVDAPPSSVGFAPGAAGAWQQAMEGVIEQARASLEEAAGRYGFTWELLPRRGDVSSALVEVASERHADVIVVGASSSARHRVLGSVPVQLVKAGQAPVTVVP